MQLNSAIRGFDVLHQLIRLKHAKSMSDSEVSTIMRTLADNTKSYEQVVEVSLFRLFPIRVFLQPNISY
jgi:hypothetical protein